VSTGAKFLGCIPFPFLTTRTNKLEVSRQPDGGASSARGSMHTFNASALGVSAEPHSCDLTLYRPCTIAQRNRI
jgi:hypothetical protein